MEKMKVYVTTCYVYHQLFSSCNIRFNVQKQMPLLIYHLLLDNEKYVNQQLIEQIIKKVDAREHNYQYGIRNFSFSVLYLFK